jgi:H+/Cl- antiporter ClcA
MMLAISGLATGLLVVGAVALMILLVYVVLDLFRRADLSTGARVTWIVILVLVPFAGSVVYLVLRAVRPPPPPRSDAPEVAPPGGDAGPTAR